MSIRHASVAALAVLVLTGAVAAQPYGTDLIASDLVRTLYRVNATGGVSTIGTYDTHAERFCSSGGLLGITFTPGAGDHYYLVVPRNGSREGSYGRASDGSERPPGSPACANQMIGPCP